MRKRTVWGIAVVATLALVAAACAKKTTSPAAGGSTGASTTATTTPAPQFTTLKQGEIQVASCLDYSPFEFTDPNTGKLTGFDVEMIDAIAAKLGVKVVWVKANFNTIFTALSENKFDAVAAAS